MKKTAFGFVIVISFAILVMSVSMYFAFVHEERIKARLDPDKVASMSTDEIREHLTDRRVSEPLFHTFYAIPFLSLLGLLVGGLVYYMIFQCKRADPKHTLKFLNPDERKVVAMLLENRGTVRQYELTHLPGLNKVSTSRIIASLEGRGIIRKERIGKTNRIVLDRKIYSVFQ